ncbi:hypothetical protein MTYM_00376 [Methylococcales bacterium]|nr:hypothetical protein MTYM_00376 [Methylococcales bacterium]
MTSKKVRKRKKKIKVVLSSEQKEQKKREKKLHEDILNLFRRMGFEYIKTDGRHVTFGGQKSDIDRVFLYENVILVCEETTGKDSDHLRKKYDFIERIVEQKDSFITWIKDIGKEKFGRFTEYSNARYRIFCLYFTEDTIEEEKRLLYNKFKYIDGRNLRYFLKIADSIRYSARNEFYKFLDLDFRDVGEAIASQQENIYSAVISPKDVSGMPQGVYLVSFVMTAKELLDCAYVFRKENWDQETGYYYQRLIEKKKINSIREFLTRERRTFIDSIIVSLPNDAKFFSANQTRGKGDPIDPKSISEVTSNAIIEIPYKTNSIGIIDGQHRVFGHHEGPDNKEEEIIAKLRNKRHLFVTGLYYQNDFKESDKRKFESQLFLEINSKQKRVDAQLLQHIESLQDPLSPIGIAMSVIQKLNGRTPFLNLFMLSEIDEKKNGIKTPSIVKFGLQQLVEINDDKEGLFKYWPCKDKMLLITDKESTQAEDIRKEYVSFCTEMIGKFFHAVKSSKEEAWTFDGKSKLLRVTAIVAFIQSFEKSIEVYKGVKDIPFYQKNFRS